MRQNTYYLITGGVGFGKTTLINELCKTGDYYKIPEIAAEIINEQIKIGGTLIPWVDRYAFEAELLKRKIDIYLSSPSNKICFFDRGIPDAIAFFNSEKKKIPQEYFEAAKNYRYNQKVFIVPPWREIYKNRPTRPQTYNEAVKLNKLIVQTYEQLGYKVIEIPKIDIKERVSFVKKHLH